MSLQVCSDERSHAKHEEDRSTNQKESRTFKKGTAFSIL